MSIVGIVRGILDYFLALHELIEMSMMWDKFEASYDHWI